MQLSAIRKRRIKQKNLVYKKSQLFNGWDFLEELADKVKKADVKVVMVTSSLSKAEREKSKEFEVVIDFWEKPMEENQVESLIKRLTDWF